jgi:phosphopentomutase
MTVRAVVLVVLDSAGIGGAPDAEAFGDVGSATIPNLARVVGGVKLPNLGALGLGRLADIQGVNPVDAPSGAFGAMTETSAGKDTTTGHWEMTGIYLAEPLPTYPNGFPTDVIEAFEVATGTKTLGNEVASGTEIIGRLGAEHVATSRPIVYTSADSVFQIATHVDVVPLERLYEMCRIARGILKGPHDVGRVIARPFEGAPGAFVRTPDRHDFSRLPEGETVLDEIVAHGLEVRGVGKISDIFGGRGVTFSHPTRSNDDGIDAIVAEISLIDRGLVFANLVDFDQAYGHRNDPHGYAQALERFDERLGEITGAMDEDDVLLITADHGNDPTTASTDHSRERVPLLVTGAPVRPGTDLGIRKTFSDCGATFTDLLGFPTGTRGTTIATILLR